MKKKFISLLLAATLVLSNSALVFAEGTDDATANTTTTVETAEDTETATEDTTTITEDTKAEDTTTAKENVTKEDKATPTPTADAPMVRKPIAEAYAAMKDGSGVIIDLRNDTDWNESHIDGSEHIAIFNNAEKPDPAGLQKEFTAEMETRKDTLSGKKIYLLCYSGNRGAQNATNSLRDLGYDLNNVFTITNGSNAALEEGYMGYQYISAFDALKAYYDGSAAIVDLRATTDYATGHLSGAYNYPVFASKGTLFTDESKFTEFTKNVTNLDTKNVYVLCYAGQVGAKKAIDLTRGIGKTVKIITNGSKDPIFEAANVANAANGIVNGRNEITYADLKAVIKAAADNKQPRPTVLDLRPYAEYRVGHFEKAISAPIFDLKDHNLFTAMQTNAKNYSGTVYVLCYKGIKGAEKATIALKSGNKDLNVVTVAGGNEGITAAEPRAMKFVAGEYALSDKNGVIIDVRTAEAYADGHIKGSISLPVVEGEGKTKTEAAKKAFIDYVTAHKAELESKNIYLLCYTGSSCAAAATDYFEEIKWAGNVMTIDFGATDATIAANLVKDGDPAATPVKKPTTDKKADNKSKSPKTGDAATTLPFVVAMGAAVLAIVNRKKIAK